MLKDRIINHFLRIVESIEYGSIQVVTPDGKNHFFSGKKSGAHGHIHIDNWQAIISFSVKGDIGFTEAYRDGWWDSNNITDLFLVGLQNEKVFDPYIYGGVFSRVVSRIMYFFAQNTLKGSRKNIHAHYDLGNDFYQLWLDRSMSYSSALFKHPGESLEQAQYNKYDRILDKLDKNSGSILEVGCGWGTFAERAILSHSFEIKGITLSEQQKIYAAERLGKNAQIVLEDYRVQQGKYDYIVSIEMFEAVGEKFWSVYFKKMASLLKTKGKILIQTITIGEHYFERYRKGGDMIRTFIFPGGMLATEERFIQEAASAGLRVVDTYAFGLDYAHTLELWLSAFEEKLRDIRELGFDESFIRIWRFYLAACKASFVAGRTDVMQMELEFV